MKKVYILIWILLGCIQWTSAQVPRLELHHIGAGDGDATLVIAIDSTTAYDINHAVVWDTCVVLIDGQRSSGGREVWRYVRDTLHAKFPNRLKLDYIVLSHEHIDHYGGLTNLIDSAKTRGWSISGVITRRAIPSEKITNAAAEIDTCYSNITLNDGIGVSLQAFYNTITAFHIPRPTLVVDSDLFHYRKFVNISMVCVAAVGVTHAQNGTDLIHFLPANSNGTFTAKSENDLSFAWLLSFQGFHYTTFGDLGGVNSGNYVDGESYITDYLRHKFNNSCYHICVHKVSHHGSAESTTPKFAAINNISLAVIPASLKVYGRSIYPLPTQTAIQNLLGNPGKTNILYTFIPQQPTHQASYWTYNYLQYYNDVILKIVGGPGYPKSGESLPITVIQHTKDLNFNYLGAPSVSHFNCTKGHNWNAMDTHH